MSKKKPRKRIGSYIRELSIVIIGVAATLYAGTLINNVKEKNDLNNQLGIIHTELESNIKSLDGLIGFYNRHEQLRKFLKESIKNPQVGTNDSILKYGYTVGELYPFIYKKNAYEMFINSGAMKLMTDRNLLLDITECYTMLEIIKDDFDKYETFKMNELQKLNDLRGASSYDKSILDPEYRNLFNFYINMQKGDYPIDAKEHIKKILSRLQQ